MARYGDVHKGGRKTKAEEHGLHKNMNDAFKRLSKGESNVAGHEKVLEMMWEKAQGGDYKAIEWLAHRFYGKEATEIIFEGNVETKNVVSLQEFINGSFEDNKED